MKIIKSLVEKFYISSNYNFVCNPIFSHAFDLFKPNYAYKFAPDWFEKLDKTLPHRSEHDVLLQMSTVRHCPAIKSSLSSGFIIPLWTDISIRIDKDFFGFQCADGMTQIRSHPRVQFQNFYNDFHHAKIISPWQIVQNKSTEIFWTAPFYFHNRPTDWIVLPGHRRFDLNNETHINLFFPIKESPYDVFMSAGTPLVHLIPLTEEFPKLKVNLAESEDSFNLQKPNLPFFTNSYTKRYKIKTKI